MNVSAGFNTAYGREKFDVIIEPADLPRVLAEQNIPVEVIEHLTASEVFRVLHYQAQVFCNQVLTTRLEALLKLPNPAAEDKERLNIARVDLSNHQAWLAGLLTTIQQRAEKLGPGKAPAGD
jgi:hypothetical protein